MQTGADHPELELDDMGLGLGLGLLFLFLFKKRVILLCNLRPFDYEHSKRMALYCLSFERNLLYWCYILVQPAVRHLVKTKRYSLARVSSTKRRHLCQQQQRLTNASLKYRVRACTHKSHFARKGRRRQQQQHQ